MVKFYKNEEFDTFLIVDGDVSTSFTLSWFYTVVGDSNISEWWNTGNSKSYFSSGLSEWDYNLENNQTFQQNIDSGLYEEII